MSRPIALITGARGEIGSLLIPELRGRGFDVVALDLAALSPEIAGQCVETVEGNILDEDKIRSLFGRWKPSHVFHLAALLSSRAEQEPDLAHKINVEGTYGLFRACMDSTSPDGPPIRFLFPSSIAAYGLPDARTKDETGAVTEHDWNVPASVYGSNKLYCELLGTYLARRGADGVRRRLDFRSIRFPGLISAHTLPSGGTTDYAPEMIHAAALGKPYSCFVREDTRLPFMTMPDGVEALLKLSEVDASRLSLRVYNVQGFSASAGELRDEVRKHYPDAEVDFQPVESRQAIVDSWPAAVDDSVARSDWGLAPRYDLAAAMRDYLVPALKQRYTGDVQVEP